MYGLSDHIDLALILLYIFWVFFFLLVLYLNREGMREGFPAKSETTGQPLAGGVIGFPTPKVFKLREGGETYAPHPEDYADPVNATPAAAFVGAPLRPTGDPMLAEFGPGAYAPRMDTPALTYHGDLKIAPMRKLDGFTIVDGDRDPRGLPVVGADKKVAGTVRDLWIDREEQLIRYVEIALDREIVDADPEHVVLAPFTMCKVGGGLTGLGVWRPRVDVSSILAAQFANVPVTKLPDEITLLEEDRICAYYGAGTLFATPERQEPLL